MLFRKTAINLNDPILRRKLDGIRNKIGQNIFEKIFIKIHSVIAYVIKKNILPFPAKNLQSADRFLYFIKRDFAASSTRFAFINPSSNLPSERKSSNRFFISATASFMRWICFSLLAGSLISLYFYNKNDEERIVLSSVLNSCEAVMANLDFNSFSSFSFSSDSLNSSFDIYSSVNVSRSILVLYSTFCSRPVFSF